jgi:hypothetical protein
MSGTGGSGGMPDAHVDAAIDAPGPMCTMNSQCNDGNFCTVNTCNNGRCVTTPRDCNDNRSCTIDGCNPSFGCTHEPDNAACNDGIDCTVDTCDLNGPLGTGCVNTPDNNLCTPSPFACVDTVCDPTRGCVHMANNAACNDGNPCTTDSCDPTGPGAGNDGCVHQPIPGCTPCQSNGDCPGTVCVPCSPGGTLSKQCNRRCSAGGTCVPELTNCQQCIPLCTAGP